MSSSRPWIVVFAAAASGALALIIAFAASRPSTPGAIEVRLPEAVAATAGPADGRIKIYIAGAVVRPGVYEVRPGDRVADAIEAAGGPAADADLPAINLARRLHDEDHILVPRPGEPVVVIGLGGEPSNGRVDVNSAPAAALETLPGIGPARAKSIVDSRQKIGPFAAPEDLVKRRLVPQSVFDGFKDRVEVR